MRRIRLALTVMVLSALAGVAAAQETAPELSGTPSKHHRAAKPARAAPPQSVSASQAWHDLVKGSPEQQQMERTDNDLAGLKPVDHHKDEFFSDWRGLR